MRIAHEKQLSKGMTEAPVPAGLPLTLAGELKVVKEETMVCFFDTRLPLFYGVRA